MGDDLSDDNQAWLEQHAETWRVDSQAELPAWWDKGVRKETIFLIFRWNNILHHSYQADEIVTEIEEWKQKVIKCVGGNSCFLKKLYYLNFKFDYS